MYVQYSIISLLLSYKGVMNYYDTRLVNSKATLGFASS